MTTENKEERPDKATHRTMGEYSISKSFKGILRVAHIMELVDGEPDYFLSPTYYGNPKQLMNISGGTYAAKEYGYQTAIKAMQQGSGIDRYDTKNIRIGNDPLRLHRVPMTDSMGNYLNWNVGTDGVTIGSNEDINGNKISITSFTQKQGEKEFVVYQEKIFPVIQSRDFVVGLQNKIIPSNKKGINNAILSIESGTHDAMIIVENMYDKSELNRTDETHYRNTSSGEYEPVTTHVYNNLITGNNPKYSKLRTVYKNTKSYSEDFDAFMFRQNDFDCDNYTKPKTVSKYNGYGNDYNEQICAIDKTTLDDNGNVINKVPFRDSIVDVTNLKDYVKKIILKYMKGNIVEVPSGAVIWQYCSLEKWRAHNESPQGDSTVIGDGGYPGHRPPLQIKETQTNNIFGATTIQGVSKKINRLKKVGTYSVENQKEDLSDPTKEDTYSMNDEDDNSLSEIIALYKRDYVLCDGSKYRIPYSAPLQKSTMTPFMEHQNRFFELFFNIGYRYTERDNLLKRPAHLWNNDKYIYIPEDASSGTTNKIPINEKNITNSCLSDNWFNNFDKLPETPPYSQWYNIKNDIKDGYGYPKMVSPSENNYDNCTDLDVLFQEDIATMIACDTIYKEYHTKNRLGGKEWTFNNIKEWLRTQRFPEEYIFNTFIGDLDEDVETYFNNSYENDEWFIGINKDKTLNFGHKQPEVMIIDYDYCPDTKDTKYINYGKKPKLPIGREVTYFGSPMKFYDNQKKKYVITSPANLPMVNFFIYIMTSNHRIDGSLQMYFFSFFNYDFQVPEFMHNSKTPVFIGSGAFSESDKNRCELKKPTSWSSNFSEGDIPHRHGIFLWCGEGNEKQIPGKPNSGYDNNFFYSLPTLTATSPTALISYSGGNVTNLCAAGSHGGTLYNHDGNGNYIVKPVPLTNEPIYGTSYCPYNLIQSQSDENIGWKTGTGYIEGTNQMTDDNPDKYEYFTENNDGDALNFKSNIVYPYSFTLKEDPRFINAEPNRGLTGPPIYIDDIKLVKFKDDDAFQAFPQTTDINWFCPENIQMLPLIKL